MKSTRKHTTFQMTNCAYLKFQWIQIWIFKCCFTIMLTLMFYILDYWCHLVCIKFWLLILKKTHLLSFLCWWPSCTVLLSYFDLSLVTAGTLMSHIQTWLLLQFRQFSFLFPLHWFPYFVSSNFHMKWLCIPSILFSLLQNLF